MRIVRAGVSKAWMTSPRVHLLVRRFALCCTFPETLSGTNLVTVHKLRFQKIEKISKG